MLHFNIVDIIALAFFILSWNIYATYTRKKSYKKNTLNYEMNLIRKTWIKCSLESNRHDRIPDIQLINVLHRGISFFVSTTILIIAGLLAFIISGEYFIVVIQELYFVAPNIIQTWHLKIAITIILFVVCFFRLTWALRQNQYAAISLMCTDSLNNCPQSQTIIDKISWIFTDSGNNFNHGLRSYYFGLAMLTWVISPYYFIVTTLIVVLVLYRREFSSTTLNLLQQLNSSFND